MKRICVIGDVVRSRSVARRSDLQGRLQKTLDGISRARRRALASPWTITLGDEFQAVYRNAGPLFNDFAKILHDVYPVQVRFSVGVGELSTPINPKRAIGMDGPGFHAARSGLGELKRSRSVLRLTDADSALPPWVNPALQLVSHEIGGWKKVRMAVFYRLLEGREVKAIAEEIGVTNAAVYKSIKSGALQTVRQLLLEVVGWMDSQAGTR